MPATNRTLLRLVPMLLLLLAMAAGLPVTAAEAGVQGQTVLVDLAPHFNNDGVATDEDPVDRKSVV